MFLSGPAERLQTRRTSVCGISGYYSDKFFLLVDSYFGKCSYHSHFLKIRQSTLAISFASVVPGFCWLSHRTNCSAVLRSLQGSVSLRTYLCLVHLQGHYRDSRLVFGCGFVCVIRCYYRRALPRASLPPQVQRASHHAKDSDVSCPSRDWCRSSKPFKIRREECKNILVHQYRWFAAFSFYFVDIFLENLQTGSPTFPSDTSAKLREYRTPTHRCSEV